MASIADAEHAQKLVRERFGRLQGIRGIGVTWTESGDAHVRVNVERASEGGLSKDEIRASLDQATRDIEVRALALTGSPEAALLDEYVKAAFLETAAR